MLPVNIHIAAEAEQHTISLREIYFVLRFGMKEGKLPCRSERYAHRDILVTSTLSVERSTVVMEWFPIT